MFRIIQKRRWLFILSLLILVPGLVALVRFGLKLGIDFTGGTRMVVAFSGDRPSGTSVIATVSDLDLGQVTTQTAGQKEMVLRLSSISNDQRQRLLERLQEKFPGAMEASFDSIGPTIGAELLRKAYLALGLVLLAIVVYVSWAFRRVNVGPVPASVYGLSAIVALAHDVLVVVGIFAILGHYRGAEIDSLFVTAVLTVLGFSVHDTIVVFDRIRERLLIGGESTFEDTVNVSLNQTLTRSLNTSLTTLFVLVALYLFGGETIKYFVLALIIGIVSGTYSSIFVASPLLVVYEGWKRRRAHR
ncbi:MAG: protein translocase subunit SecF [Candidatus Kerfeldbacteria bacterium]|nr:protein translocase subunit SecF [Candidatus Kerfeldbacteria bacterium]